MFVDCGPVVARNSPISLDRFVQSRCSGAFVTGHEPPGTAFATSASSRIKNAKTIWHAIGSSFVLGGLAGGLSRRRRCASSSARHASAQELPRCVVFDLDGCLWHPDMYMLWGGGAPFKKQPDGTLKDQNNRTVALHAGTRAVFNELADDAAWKGVTVAIASCSDEPTWARECLRKFESKPGRALMDVIGESVCHIHGGNKKRHLMEIAQVVGCDTREMIFFDNEPYNCDDVSELGVSCVYCPGGVTEDVWREALDSYPCPGKIVGPRGGRRR